MKIDIIGKERQNILEKLYKHFRYNGKYWIPISNIKIDKEVVVISSELGVKHTRQIEGFLKNKSESFYLSGEKGYIEPFREWLQEVDYLDLNYGPVEFVYFDKDFDWFIYISHEDTIAFCGDQLIEFIQQI